MDSIHVPTGRLEPKTRHLMLLVWDGDNHMVPHLYQMANLFHCNEVLSWLVKNNITGKKFIGWLSHEHEGSLLKAISYILMKINRDLIAKPLIHGKDLL